MLQDKNQAAPPLIKKALKTFEVNVVFGAA
jgi:hypothetical protein